MKTELKKHVVVCLTNALPDDYWNTVCTYLNKYHQRHEVLESDMLTKYVDGEEFGEIEDYEDMVDTYGDKLTANVHLKVLDTELYIEALEHFKEVYCKEIALAVSVIQRENLISGTLFQTFDQIYDIACAYVVRNHVHNSEYWEQANRDYDETVIKFAKQCIKSGTPTDDNHLSY
mgnify:CR=1 FL=1